MNRHQIKKEIKALEKTILYNQKIYYSAKKIIKDEFFYLENTYWYLPSIAGFMLGWYFYRNPLILKITWSFGKMRLMNWLKHKAYIFLLTLS